MRMITKTLNAALFLSLAVLSAQAQDLSHGLIPEVPKTSFAPFNELLVVSAETLNPGPHNNGNPPKGLFRIHRILRRGKITGEEVHLRWVAGKFLSHYEEWEPSMPEDWRIRFDRRPLKPGWEALPLPAPPLGEKIIIVAQHEDEPPTNVQTLTVYAAYPSTENNLAIILKHMGRTDWSPRLLAYLFRGVFILAVLAAGRLASSFVKDLAIQKRRLKLGGILFGASFLLWLVFEYGNVTGGIRIDLLFLFPLFLLSIALLIASGAVLKFRIHRQDKDGANKPPERYNLPRSGAS